MSRIATAAATCLFVLALSAPAHAAGNPEIAALQVGLRQKGLYAGNVDGVLSASTANAVRRLQRRAGIAVDGVPGPQTKAALGRYGLRSPLGRRPLAVGMRGWDVAALQFALAWHGFPSGNIDGTFGGSTERALRKFQVWAGLPADGRAGAAVFAALRRAPTTCPLPLSAPVAVPFTDTYGPRGHRFHTGIEFPAAAGVPVTAAAPGRVTFAGWSSGGWGNLVVIAHTDGVRTMYAHLSRVAVRVGQRVGVGARVGRVGSSGNSTGPHLHFEVRVRGAAVDPVAGLRR
jgi:murein DD-endopeptidase MepM/ murein hydrolase activator NlpD